MSSKVRWTFAAVLCLCTLVALWATAMSVREKKLAARRGERILPTDPAPPPVAEKPRLRVGPDSKPLDEFFSRAPKGATVDVELDPASPPGRQQEVLSAAEKHSVPIRFVAGDGRLMKLQLRRGQKLAVEHFTLVCREETLSVLPFVEFVQVKKGDQRGWQELRLTVLEADPTGLLIEAEIRPGAPSTGDGWYSSLRAGLQVEFDGKRVVTITSWDPAKPELKLRIQQGDQVEEKTLDEDARAQGFGLTVWLRKDALLLKSR